MSRFIVGLVLGCTPICVVGCEGTTESPEPTRCGAAKPSNLGRSSPPPLSSLSDEEFEQELAAVEKDIDPAAGGVELMWTKGDWAVWSSTRPIEKFADNRMRRELCKTYLQRLPAGAAKFVEKHVGSPFHYDTSGVTAAATDDGTLIAHRGHEIVWRSSDGTTVKSPQLKEWVKRVDIDGVLVQEPSTSGAQGRQIAGAFRFVPFNGKELDRPRAVELAPPGIEAFLHHDAPVRHADEFGWTDDRVAQFVDIKTGKRRRVELKAPAVLHDSHFRIVAFDERVIHGVLLAFDAVSGEVLGEADLSKRSGPYPPLIALHGGISYHIVGANFGSYRRGGRIVAMDPHSKVPGYVAVAEAPHLPLGRSATGLNIWSGTKWDHVPWLTSIADDAPRVEVK